MLAKPSRQALGDDEMHRGGNVEWRHAHVHQTRERARSIVCVQG